MNLLKHDFYFFKSFQKYFFKYFNVASLLLKFDGRTNGGEVFGMFSACCFTSSSTAIYFCNFVLKSAVVEFLESTFCNFAIAVNKVSYK